MSHTPVTYGRQEVAAILAQLRKEIQPTCPRCKVDLVEPDPQPTKDLRVFEAYCPKCLHCLFLRRDLAEPDHD